MPRGRPKGSKNKKTLEREAKERERQVQAEAIQKIIETPSQKEKQVRWTTFAGRYFKGQRFFYIYTNDFTGTKAIFEIVVHTAKPNVLICNVEDDPSFICVGPEEEDLLFSSFEEAQKVFKQIKVKCLYGSATQEGEDNGTKKKRGRPRKNSGVS